MHAVPSRRSRAAAEETREQRGLRRHVSSEKLTLIFGTAFAAAFTLVDATAFAESTVLSIVDFAVGTAAFAASFTAAAFAADESAAAAFAARAAAHA